MDHIYFDFETRSGADLTKQGLYNYVHNAHSDIVCLSYMFDGGEVKLWTPGMPVPDFIQNIPKDCIFIAFNAYFDWKIWNMIGPAYSFGTLPKEQVLDLRALCARYGYPQSLNIACKTLGLSEEKIAQGKYLIKKICCPPFKHTEAELLEFYEYGKQDTRLLYLMHKALPTAYLTPNEQRIWEHTVDINETGIPVNVSMAEMIKRVTEVYQEAHAERLPELTDGKVTKITQIQRIKLWCQTQGYMVENMQAPTIEKSLEDPYIPPNVKELLIMRRDLGKSSLAKYSKILAMQYNGRIYDTLNYHGALTGRYSGKGFQTQSLPRNSLDDKAIETALEKFQDLSILDGDPIITAKELVRPTINVELPYSLIAADYTAIENRVLAWYANDEKTLQLFRDGQCQYTDMAAFLIGKSTNDISQEERRKGKIIILGCGYGMGPKTFRKTADSMGWEMSESEAIHTVSQYRYKYKKVVNMWYDLIKKATQAISTPGIVTMSYNCKFVYTADRNGTYWLVLTLPTKRHLFYNSPKIEAGSYGPIIKFKGMNPYTRKWDRLTLLLTKLINNIVQGTARDILVESQMTLQNAGYKIVLSLHDEIVIEHEYASTDVLHQIIKIMTDTPKTLTGLPLNADGYIGQYYRKF